MMHANRCQHLLQRKHHSQLLVPPASVCLAPSVSLVCAATKKQSAVFSCVSCVCVCVFPLRLFQSHGAVGVTVPPPAIAAQMAACGCEPGGLGLTYWASIAVHHCQDAYGLVIVHRDGWKLVYSGTAAFNKQ